LHTAFGIVAAIASKTATVTPPILFGSAMMLRRDPGIVPP
jgi:hypothetical protein